eukprot:gene17025-23315_t
MVPGSEPGDLTSFNKVGLPVNVNINNYFKDHVSTPPFHVPSPRDCARSLPRTNTVPLSLLPGDLASLKQVGLPVNQSDVVSLLHKSLSNLIGQNVHFRPYLFSNIFQSAPVVANYVASALEGGQSWGKVERFFLSSVERFFLSSVEADPNIKSIKVMVSGRLGRKASMASIKEWQYGEHRLDQFGDYVDYGTAGALTRMGMTGVKVWIRYQDHAIPDNYFSRETGFKMPLAKPKQNRSWETFGPEFDSTRTHLETYLKEREPKIFRNMEKWDR